MQEIDPVKFARSWQMGLYGSDLLILALNEVYSKLHPKTNKQPMNKVKHRLSYEALVKKIRQVREEKNLCQEYLARVLNISQNAYSKIEIGKTKLTVLRLLEIAEVLGVSPETLLITEQ